MAELKEFLSRIKLVRQRSSNFIKIMVIVTIALCMGAMCLLRMAMIRVQNETDDLRSKAAALEEERDELNEKIQQVGSNKSVQDIAQEQLGMVDPETVVFQPEE